MRFVSFRGKHAVLQMGSIEMRVPADEAMQIAEAFSRLGFELRVAAERRAAARLLKPPLRKGR